MSKAGSQIPEPYSCEMKISPARARIARHPVRSLHTRPGTHTSAEHLLPAAVATSIDSDTMHKDKILKLAKGFRGRSKNCIRVARERVEKSLQYAFRDRRNKKRDMRALWIQQINAGARQYGVRRFARGGRA